MSSQDILSNKLRQIDRLLQECVDFANKEQISFKWNLPFTPMNDSSFKFLYKPAIKDFHYHSGWSYSSYECGHEEEGPGGWFFAYE